jgi:hypothetical protein
MIKINEVLPVVAIISVLVSCKNIETKNENPIDQLKTKAFQLYNSNN